MRETHEQEIKEYLDRQEFARIMRQWLDALEGGQDLNISLKGQDYRIPQDAWENGRLRVEYEVSEDELEFEMTVKCKPPRES